MVELANNNALLRVRSRMVTSTFIILSCAASPLFSSLRGAITQVCVIASIRFFFQTYRQQESVGHIYFGFLFFALASLAFPQVLYLVPFLMILMATQLQSFSIRGFFASLFGLITPYWLLLPWFIYQQDFSPLSNHLSQLGLFATPYQDIHPTVGLIVFFTLMVILSITGIIHFWLRSYEDKIRNRLLYGFFTSMLLLCIFFVLVQPQHAEVLIRLIIVFASPLIAHFFTHTDSRITNIVFIVATLMLAALIIFNLWMPSLTF